MCVAPGVTAQTPEPSWKKNFDDVEVLEVGPDDLPGPEESVLPSTLSARSALPRATSLETLRRSAAAINDLVLEVVVVPRSNSPIRQTAIVVQGEAVWISAKANAADPILVTNAHYLLDVEAVFVRPAPARKSGDLPTVQRRSVREMSLGADVKALLNDKSLIPVTVEQIDKHRNLAVLRAPQDKLKTPVRGIAFFPIEDQAASAAYGFSHKMGSALVQTQFLAPNVRRDELEYFLHTTYPVILGAPIVADDGRLIAITSMRHPNEPERTLVIPPRALRKYVEKVHADRDEKPDEDAAE